MANLINKLFNLKHLLVLGNKIFQDKYFLSTKEFSKIEKEKSPTRTEIINFLLTLTNGGDYLEIGVRDPSNNFDKINCKNKYSVVPFQRMLAGELVNL